jgi:hypothetical protein
MLRSRVGLALIVALSLFSISGYADDGMYNNNGMMMSDNSMMYGHPYASYNGYVRCFVVKAHHHAGRFIPRHRVCLSSHGYATCAKYVYSITPMHRDRYCSQWAWHGYRGWYGRHHSCGWKR